MKNIFLSLFILIFISGCSSNKSEQSVSIIPHPVSVKKSPGTFSIKFETTLYSNLPDEDIAKLKDYLKLFDIELKDSVGESKENTINIIIDSTSTDQTSESYHLNISPDYIEIKANTASGIFYGLQSLLQLAETNGKTDIPCLEIEDKPRFVHRGLMLDVVRHFYSKEFVKKQLDIMAYFKFNTLHWHITDGAGWRIEIKKYPQLTEQAAWRPMESIQEWIDSGKPLCTKDHPTAYGGYYTQEDIKEIVQYAQDRHITVIPEIEMPGHSEEVLAVFPHLSCSKELVPNSDYCVGNEDSFRFLQDVLLEVFELFPSQYIHIGGDEADKTAWKTCPKCNKRMKEKGLKNVDELQSYMIHRMEVFLNRHDKKLLGWDEILEGGLAPNATVMTWRGEEGGIQAAKRGHHIIMTPNGYCYFDSYQDAPLFQLPAMSGYLPLSKVYSYDPIPESLKDKKDLILGVQANIWTEWITTEEHIETMLYPRLLAMAEVAWSPLEVKDYDNFKQRVITAHKFLDKKGVTYFDIREEKGNREESLSKVNHLALNNSVAYTYPSHPKYEVNKKLALTDGIRGNWGHGDGGWQGFLDNNFEVIVDMKTKKNIKEVTATFMQEHHAWIWLPKEVEISISNDNENFRQIKLIENTLSTDTDGYHLTDFSWEGEEKARYVKYKATNNGIQGGWLFTDEIIIR